jgi:hypothetical protein
MIALPRKKIFLILLLLIFTGCSSKEVRPPLAQSDTDAPYQLRIDDEVFDGKKLFIKATVEQFTSEVSAPSVLRLKTIKNGTDLGESFVPFEESQKGEQLQLSADAEGFTDYQVDLLWGSDAEGFLKSVPPSKFVTIKDTMLVSDTTGSKINGTIENTGYYPISNLPLTVEFQWVKSGDYLDLSVHDPEATTEVILSDVTIEPKQTRSFSIALDSELPVHEGEKGAWQVIVKAES